MYAPRQVPGHHQENNNLIKYTIMKRIFLMMMACIALTSCASDCYKNHGSSTINLDTLLDEMLDRDGMTRYPESGYVQKQVSSYDRRSIAPDQEGWFANVDGGGYERLDTVGNRLEKVMFDEKGPGAITRIWMTTKDKYGVLRIYLDGAEEPQIVIPAYDMKRFPMDVPAGLSLTHTHYVTAMDGVGGNSFFLPIPYSKSCKVTFEEPDINVWVPRYYHINYRTWPEGTSVETFTLENAAKLATKMEEVSNALLNPTNCSKGTTVKAEKNVDAGETVSVALPAGTKAVRNLIIKVSGFESDKYGDVMRALDVLGSFDGKLCINVPLADFSGAGMGAPEVDGWYLKSDAQGNVTCRFVMPYRENGEICVKNNYEKPVTVTIEATACKYNWTDNSLYFHTSFRSELAIPLNNNYDTNDNLDWNFMTIKGRGVYVGDLLSLYNYAIDWYGEGDEKIWVDDDTFPSHFGTGTEDYFNCSWAPVVPFLTPYGGAPRADETSSHGYNAFMRTRNLDAIPFSKSFKYDIEMLSWNLGTADYYTTSYWYGDYDSTVNSTK